MSKLSVEELIDRLELKPHPEGGFFRETYRAAERLAARSLPARYGADRSIGTAIYYLLTPDSCSHLHRVSSDEVFHFYLGDPVVMLMLFPDRHSCRVKLGHNVIEGEVVQHIVPHSVWQGMRLVDGGSFALLGATVAPGFDYADFELATRAQLAAQYPDERDMIARLT